MSKPYVPAMRDEAVKAKTGRAWSQWFAALDAWDAPSKGHAATARHLAERHGVPDWWCQAITVEYERARGLRKVGQRTAGDWEVSLQRTLDASAATLVRAWRASSWLGTHGWESRLRAALPQARASKTAMGPVLRLTLGQERVDLTFSPKGRGRTALRVQHRGLASEAARDRARARWRSVLAKAAPRSMNP